jgi:hypothetical protein
LPKRPQWQERLLSLPHLSQNGAEQFRLLPLKTSETLVFLEARHILLKELSMPFQYYKCKSANVGLVVETDKLF